MSTPAACTIASNNYLAFARVLAKSFLEHHPDGQFFTLIVDRPDPGIDYQEEPFQTRFVEDLAIPAFRNMAFRYSILELNTAVKPFWLSYLHQEFGLPHVCYFDPDILILDSLHDLFLKLAESDVLLTPHITCPIQDQRHPSERDILTAGIYNLGFLGVALNPRSLGFLDWWGEKLHESGVSQIEKGLFVDQKWMDFAPAFLAKASILHDPGLNAAYWNLMQRGLSCQDGKWRADDVPLRFFHFSGFNPGDAAAVSKHQDRFTLADLPHLGPLFQHHSRRLIEEGAETLRASRYTYGFFDNGVAVPDFCRASLHLLDKGARWPDPFKTGPGSFYDWLRAPAPQHPELPRLALSLWDQEPFCQQTFSFGRSHDARRFGRWLVSEGARIHGIDEALLDDWQPLLGSTRMAGLGGRTSAGHDAQGRLDSILRSTRPGPALSRWLADLGGASGHWLKSDVALEERGPCLSRLAFAIYLSRQDLKDLYPHPLGPSRGPLARWFVTHGAVEYELPLAAVAPVLSSFHWRQQTLLRLWWLAKKRVWRFTGRDSAPGQDDRHEDAPPAPAQGTSSRPARGLHVIGYLEAPTGKGEEGRGTLAALQAAAIPHRGWSLSGTTQAFAEEDSAMLDLDQGEVYPVALYHVNADMMKAVRRQLPPRLRSAALHLGYWDWELSHFPLDFGDRFEGLAEVWAPSHFCRRAFASLSSVPVRRVPPCVIPAEADPMPRSSLGLPEEDFLFFHSFDIRSIPERKNPQGLLAAFRLLSQEAGQAHLLLKINHAGDQPSQLDLLRQEAEGLPVTFLTRQMSRQEMNSLMAACDCYVSLHRSEGLGLPLIEAMYLEKPVVATGYSGNADFLDPSTGWPVAYSLCRLDEAIGPYPAGAVWAQPDPEAAAQMMLRVLTQPREREKRAQEARRKVLETYSPQAAGRRLAQELDRLLSTL